ncbi:MAG TPA: MtrB/PioB family outer membrane beta-barrel protein, partial [Rhodocyclaceae bacterium]
TQLNNVLGGTAEGTENVIWDARLRQTTTAWGVTLRGRPLTRLAVAAELSRSTDKAEHDLAQTGGTGTIGPSSLPDYRYRTTTLKLSGDYTLDRYSGVQVEIIADQRENNDWTWPGWTYSDGTMVINPADETAVFAGVRYRYRWR